MAYFCQSIEYDFFSLLYSSEAFQGGETLKALLQLSVWWSLKDESHYF